MIVDRTSKRFVLSALLLAAPVSQTLSACDGDPAAEEEEFTDGCGDPQYVGSTSDEAWKAIVDAYADAAVGSASAVTITAPAADTKFPASGSEPTFAWTSPIARGPLHPQVLAHAPETRKAMSWLDDALSAVGGFFVGTAHGHLPPVTGDVYYIELKTAGSACPIARALTTSESWVPDADNWEAIKATVGVPIEIVITSVYLSENRITEGPYRPTTGVVFEVQ